MMSILTDPVSTALVQMRLLQLGVPDVLEETAAEFGAFLPRLLAAIAVLLIGWIVGLVTATLVRRLADRIQIDRMVQGTPIGRFLGGTERAVSRAFGTLAKWFVYAVALLAAANVLAISLLSEWISTAVSYLPAFIAGLLVIVLGFIVADFIGDAIMRTRAATQTEYTSVFSNGTRIFLYFTAIVIGLDTMGIDVGILFVFANAFAWGIAAALAIGVGIALGWGGHTYVQENIDRWMARTAGTRESHETAQTNGGESESGID